MLPISPMLSLNAYANSLNGVLLASRLSSISDTVISVLSPNFLFKSGSEDSFESKALRIFSASAVSSNISTGISCCFILSC